LSRYEIFGHRHEPQILVWEASAASPTPKKWFPLSLLPWWVCLSLLPCLYLQTCTLLTGKQLYVKIATRQLTYVYRMEHDLLFYFSFLFWILELGSVIFLKWDWWYPCFIEMFISKYCLSERKMLSFYWVILFLVVIFLQGQIC
jgi:hypothetical protein